MNNWGSLLLGVLLKKCIEQASEFASQRLGKLGVFFNALYWLRIALGMVKFLEILGCPVPGLISSHNARGRPQARCQRDYLTWISISVHGDLSTMAAGELRDGPERYGVKLSNPGHLL